MIFLPRPSSEHPHSRPACSGWFSFSDLKYFQRLCCSTALCPRFPPLKTNSPTWPAWASCTPWRVPDYAGPLGRTSWSTVKTRTAILNSSWLSTTSRRAGRTSCHWRRASRSVLGCNSVTLYTLNRKLQRKINTMTHIWRRVEISGQIIIIKPDFLMSFFWEFCTENGLGKSR